MGMQCMDTEVRCDNGMSKEGCWKGDYCMPEGSKCPAVCMDTDVRCDHGTNAGVWMGDYCMPEGSICPPACNTPAPSECTDTDVRCDNGMSPDGCWMGDYCMPTVSSSAERGIMCDKILGPDTLNVDMG